MAMTIEERRAYDRAWYAKHREEYSAKKLLKYHMEQRGDADTQYRMLRSVVQRERYRTDEEYREKRKAYAREYYRRHKDDRKSATDKELAREIRITNALKRVRDAELKKRRGHGRKTKGK